MRGASAQAILKRMELDELVASPLRPTIGLAVKLSARSVYRGQVRSRMETSRSYFYATKTPIDALGGLTGLDN